MFSAKWFFDLEKKLRDMGLDSDNQSFDEILDNLQNKKIYLPDDFASHCAYVILAGGFSQQTAKKIHQKIFALLKNNDANFNTLIQVFNNKNKINAICKIWENRHILCNEYYMQKSLDAKLNYLQKLPHIGKITANHLARNLGEDVVKYDIWIQRLGCIFANKKLPIDNGKLSPEIKSVCDDMFLQLCRETKLPRGKPMEEGYLSSKSPVFWSESVSGLPVPTQRGDVMLGKALGLLRPKAFLCRDCRTVITKY